MTPRHEAFAQHAQLDLEKDQSLIHAAFPWLRCADHALVWRDLRQNALVLTIAPYGDRRSHQDALIPTGLLYKRIPSGLGPYDNDETTQYLICLPHAESEFEIIWQRLMQ